MASHKFKSSYLTRPTALDPDNWVTARDQRMGVQVLEFDDEFKGWIEIFAWNDRVAKDNKVVVTIYHEDDPDTRHSGHGEFYRETRNRLWEEIAAAPAPTPTVATAS